MHQVLGLYRRYPHESALDNFELAQQEIISAYDLMVQGCYEEALVEVDLAYHDMESSIEILDAPLSDVEAYPDITGWTDVDAITSQIRTLTDMYPKIPQAINAVEEEQSRLKTVRDMIEKQLLHYGTLKINRI